MDIDTSTADPSITYNSITVKKIKISSISIDPLKRIANFTVSYWNGTIFLGSETYTYKATYTTISDPQPLLKSLSVPSTTSYDIIIRLARRVDGVSQPDKLITFTSPYPYLTYLTSGLPIYYSQIDPSIISFNLENTPYTTVTPSASTNTYTYTLSSGSGTFISSTNYASSSDNTAPGVIPYLSITNASYSYVELGKIRVFYSVNDVQYNVIINQPAQPLLCQGGITALYTNSDNSSLSLTTDPINFKNIFPLGTNDTLTVKSDPKTTVSNSAIQTNMYDTIPIYKSVSALPTLTIYYNPNKISEIFATPVETYTQVSASFTSVTFKAHNSYQFSNLSYTAVNTNGTSVIITFQSKQLLITSSAIEPDPASQIYYNPLNTSDIGFYDNPTNYNNIISIMSLPISDTATKISNLINTFNTIKNNTRTFLMDSTKGTLSIS